MNKKKIIIISVPIIILLVGIYLLYNTFAISSYVSDNSDTYTINLTNGNNTIDVPSKSSKIVYYKINNTNSGTVKYGIGYNSSNIIVKVYEDSKDPVTGLVSSKDNKFVKLKLINNSTNNDTVTLDTIFGYENGGDLILPSGVTLVTQKIKKVNTIKNAESNVSAASNFLGTTLVRNTIESITITNDNIVPTNAIGSFDVSNSNDGSIMLWYTKGSSDNLYNVYIGSESGKVYAPSNCYMYFSNLTNATKMDLSYFDTSNTTWMKSMFRNCNSVKKLDLGMFHTSNVTNMMAMFSGCISLIKLNVNNFNTVNVVSMTDMFANCQNITEIDLSGFKTSNVTDISGMFYQNYLLEKIDISNFDTSKVTNMSNLFCSCKKLTFLNLSNFDTSKVTNMYCMFYNCNLLVSLDLSSFITSNVINMGHMFDNCSSLAKLDVSNFNTNNTIYMHNMFSRCKSLTTLNLSNFDTTKVIRMEYMFNACNNLEEIILGDKFITSNVTNMAYMFTSCYKLDNLDLSIFVTNNVINMAYMFYENKALNNLDLSSFDTSKVEDTKYMFASCDSLTTIYVSNNWNVASVTSSEKMFTGDNKLVGAISYDSSKTDVSMANYTNGYLTKK